MSVFFISDLHLGHRKILEYSPERQGETVEQHDEWIFDCWSKRIRSNKDMVWVLGDVAFSKEKLLQMRSLPGRKRLIRGNHDKFSLYDYLEVFEDVYGIWKQYHMWMTHAPVHPDSLRNRLNIHGHTHSNSVRLPRAASWGESPLDKRYINVCVEALSGIPIQLEEIREQNR